jgi:hypothetical protein
MSVFPIEILENIARFLDGKSLYNLSLVEPEIKPILENSDVWIVRFPPVIDWTSPNAPKDYREYDKADFTIEYKKKIYRRSDGFWFRLTLNKSGLIRTGKQPSDEKLILELKNMVIASSYKKKCLTIGRSQEEIDSDFVLSFMKNWPYTERKDRSIPIVYMPRAHYFDDEYVPEPRRTAKKKPEKVYYDEDGDFSLIEKGKCHI